MIFTEKQLKYLDELPSTVAHALPKARNPAVPFFLDDSVIRSYELLRLVWLEGKSVKAACRTYHCSRTEFYRLEEGFLSHGMAAIYPSLGSRDQSPKLERLALLVNRTRPRATETAVLRLAEALRMDPLPSLHAIGHVLHCHGRGNTRDQGDIVYWEGIQEIVRTLQLLKSQPGPPRSKGDRKKTFYVADEALQLRFELFRELALDPNENVGKAIARYGISRPTFYKYLRRFRLYGAWGLVDWLQAGRGRDKASEDLELRIMEEKLEHPRLGLDELVARMGLKCSRTVVYEVLRFWGLMQKDRAPVRLRGFWGEEEHDTAGDTLAHGQGGSRSRAVPSSQQG